MRLLDALGCGLAARDNDVAVRTLALARRGSEGPSTYWLAGGTGEPDACAFVNSVLAHAILHEDVGQGGHPGSHVIPAALAVAESEQRSGRELATAIAAGYEVQARLGAGDLLHAIGDRGLRGTTVTGCFGAAAAAARLLELDAEATSSALAFAASLCAPGIEEPLLVGSDERCLQVAANTRAGVLSASLAREGLVGAATALRGDAGFFAVYGGRAGDRPEVVARIGAEWASDALVFKPYPTAGWNVGPVYSVLRIVAEHGVRWEDVERVEVLHTWWHRNTGYVRSGPFETMEQALVSCNFAVACALVHGRYDWEVAKASLADERVERLAQRVHVDGVATWGFTDGAVTVVTRGGGRLVASAADIPPQLVQPAWRDVVEKFHGLTWFMDTERRERLVKLVDGIADSMTVTPLAAALAEPAPDDRAVRARRGWSSR